MTFQKRLQRIMRKRGWRVADLARSLDYPYTTVREWALHGREPAGPANDRRMLERRVTNLED